MRKAPKIVGLGVRYDQDEGRSSVIPAEQRQGASQTTRLSVGEAWRLVRTPSSENGIYEYYRVLLGRPPEPQGLLNWLHTLHVGEAMRLEVLAQIAGSAEARRRGLSGPGLRLISLAARGARWSGLAGRVKRRRFHQALVELLERPHAAPAGSRAAAPAVSEAQLEARVRRILDEAAPAGSAGGDEVAELSDRLSALEDAVLELLNQRARNLRLDGGRAPAARA